MTAEEKADLHVILLQALRAKGDVGRTVEALLHHVRMIGGFQISKPELESECQQLADKNWITRMDLDLGLPRYCIAPIGVAKLTQSGL